MNKHLFRAVAALISCAGIAVAQESPFVRVTEPNDQTSRLEVAVRTLVPDENGPVVRLVGAVHIADPSFYEELQAWLDAHDLVLYEGVGGGHEPQPEPAEAAATLATDRRLRLIGMLAEQMHRDTGRYPTSSAQIVESFEGATRTFVASAFEDAWGNPVQLQVRDGFDAMSFGADGRPGGEGDDADRRFSKIQPHQVFKPEGAEAKGLQRDLADALGLAFQLDGIDYSHPHWRNSDLNVEQIRAALAGEPIPPKRKIGATEPAGDSQPAPAEERSGDRTDAEKAADMLFGALSGDSFLAKSMGFLVKLMGSSQQGRAMIKIVLSDTLCNADAILESQPGALGELMKVLTVDRNKQVVADLREVVEKEPGARSVAIFYGAGHFADLEKRICEELGYRYESTTWIPAITVDVKESGLSAEQVKSFRSMMRRTIEQQMKRGD